jgi:hypothetical protein
MYYINNFIFIPKKVHSGLNLDFWRIYIIQKILKKLANSMKTVYIFFGCDIIITVGTKYLMNRIGGT